MNWPSLWMDCSSSNLWVVLEQPDSQFAIRNTDSQFTIRLTFQKASIDGKGYVRPEKGGLWFVQKKGPQCPFPYSAFDTRAEDGL